MFGGTGRDTMDGDEGDDLVRGDHGNDVLLGGPGRDTLHGLVGNDRLIGGDDRDVMPASRATTRSRRARTGAPTALVGGPGADTADYRASDVRVEVTLAGGGGNDGPVGDPDANLGAVENARGGSVGDRLTGSATGNVIRGEAGDDTIDGAAQTTCSSAGGVRHAARRDRRRPDPGPRRPARRHRLRAAEGRRRDRPRRRRPGRIVGCEQVEAFAVDDGPPSRAVGTLLRVRSDRTALVTIACPKTARLRCAGKASTCRSPRGGRTQAPARPPRRAHQLRQPEPALVRQARRDAGALRRAHRAPRDDRLRLRGAIPPYVSVETRRAGCVGARSAQRGGDAAHRRDRLLRRRSSR